MSGNHIAVIGCLLYIGGIFIFTGCYVKQNGILIGGIEIDSQEKQTIGIKARKRWSSHRCVSHYHKLSEGFDDAGTCLA